MKKSAEISANLDAKGLKVDNVDILIAGIVLSNGYTEILTNNVSHFENIQGLKIYTY